MNSRKLFSGFIIHYGISTILLTMMIGIINMLQCIEIRNKIQIELIRISSKDVLCYFDDITGKNLHKGDSILLYIKDDSANLELRISKIRKEKMYFVVLFQGSINDINNKFDNATKITAYFYTNKLQLWDLVFSKRFDN